MQVPGCANICREGAKRNTTHRLAEAPSSCTVAPASLPGPAAGRAPALGWVGDQHLPCLPESGVAEKLAAALSGGETVEPVAGGAPGCQAQAFLPPAENCCCLFSFSFFLRERGKPSTKDYRAFGPAQAQSGPTLSRN